MQKVAKKNILLICFEFSTSISSVQLDRVLKEEMRLYGSKWGQIRANWTKQGQTDLNRAKRG